MTRRVLFVTGRLAEPSLRRVLGQTAWPFDYDVAVLRITVAALMTTEWIARFLTVPDPRLAVLRDTPRLFRAIRIKLTGCEAGNGDNIRG